VVRAMRRADPRLRFVGVGGERMRAAGVHLEYHIRQMSLVGLTEIVRHLPFIRQALRRLDALLEEHRPALVILIDYPGLHMRLGRLVSRRGIPILYYIPPQVWAWGRGRLKQLRAIGPTIAAVLPFERAFYAGSGLEVTFVGHPLIGEVRPQTTRGRFLRRAGLDPNRPVIGLLPGSRISELRRHLPVLETATAQLRKKSPRVQFMVAAAPDMPQEAYQSLCTSQAVVLVMGATYDVMAHADCLAVASGTATLEAAMLGTPMVVFYRVSEITYWVGRTVMKVPWLGLVNNLLGREAVPELLQHACTGESLAQALGNLLRRPAVRRRQQADLAAAVAMLGRPGAARRVARLARDLMNREC